MGMDCTPAFGKSVPHLFEVLPRLLPNPGEFVPKGGLTTFSNATGNGAMKRPGAYGVRPVSKKLSAFWSEPLAHYILDAMRVSGI